MSIRKAIATLQRFNGVVEQASEQELAEEVARADRTGMFNCPHTGVALAALRKFVERRSIHGHERVVVISTAHGLKFADQKIAYHSGALPKESKASQANQPVAGERRSKEDQRSDLALRRAGALVGQLILQASRSSNKNFPSENTAGNRWDSAPWRCMAASRGPSSAIP